MDSLDYGIIGNGQINALVSSEGNIEWACMPAFDSPSVFSAILDKEQGGCFKVKLKGFYGTEQQYLKNTVILETRYLGRNGAFNIIDFVPRFYIDAEAIYKPAQIYRLIEVTQGEPQVEIYFDPRFDYARGETHCSIERGVLVAVQGEQKLYLYSNLDYQKILDHEEITLTQGSFLVLSYMEPLQGITYESVIEKFQRTTHYWRGWVKHCYLPANYQNEIIRSALTLKLLVYDDTGGVIAAPTSSLPEIFGENRNWDYRYCWLRDSYFIVNALMKLSQFEELEGFIRYLKLVLGKKVYEAGKDLENLRPLYAISGRPAPMEEILSHLKGFNGSQPVRIGNDATNHFQIDIYGEVIQALYPMFFDQRIVREDLDQLWNIVKDLVDLAIKKFPDKDNGIWEFRNARRHYTFSKLMCWVAVDRGVKIARHLSKAEVSKWTRLRDVMRNDILKKAWNPDVQAFTQSYGSQYLDASTLLMPVYGFISAKDPRMKNTITQSENLLMKNGFAFRYTNEDDLGVPQNAFLVCTFWFIDALILAGESKKALYYFENVLQYSNHVGLFSEDVDPQLGVLTGNFPQGYTHVAIINTAMKLNNHHEVYST